MTPEIRNQLHALSHQNDQMVYKVDKMSYDIDMLKDDVNRYRRNQGDFLARVDQVERKFEMYNRNNTSGTMSNNSQNFMSNMSGMTMFGHNNLAEDKYLNKLKNDYTTQPLQKIAEQDTFKTKQVPGFSEDQNPVSKFVKKGTFDKTGDEMFGEISIINQQGKILGY